MHTTLKQRTVHSEAEIARILLDLTAVTDGEDLRAWASTTHVELERLVAIETLTYVRLAGRDLAGGPIVLMLLDGAWERIF